MDLEIVGRHALLFDDDTQSAFINSRNALVPWNDDNSILIDRYDVRHLLSSIASRKQRYAEMEFDGVSKSDLDRERYIDLPDGENDDGENGSKGTNHGEEAGHGTYQAVPFSYSNGDNSTSNGEPGINLDHSGYRPPFPLPEQLLSCLPTFAILRPTCLSFRLLKKDEVLSKPPTEKLHQIIARTAIFISRHGGQSEIVLRVKQGDNPTFGFLMPSHHLHPYFRFLVEHPNLLSADPCSSEARDEQNMSGSCGKKPQSKSGGALSLLGSAYGSFDDDEAANQEASDSKPVGFGNAVDAVIGEKRQQSSKATAPDPVSGSETKSLPSQKEGTLSLKKNQPVVTPNSFSASSKIKPKADAVNLLASKVQPSMSEIEKLIVEPPSAMKETVDKIVEFILRNGREFEAVLIEQDRSHGRFPFLLPSNLYHPYYLKVLQEAQELKRQGERPRDKKHNSHKKVDGDKRSREKSVPREKSVSSQNIASPSEGLYDLERKEKFKMVIGGSKKDWIESSSKPAPKESGVTYDMAAAIVMEATRGLSSPMKIQTPSVPSTITTDMAAAIVMAATRGSTTPPESNGPSKISGVDSGIILGSGQSHHSSSLGSLSAFRNSSISISGFVSNVELGNSVPSLPSGASGQSEGKGGVDSVKVANAIAKNVALAAASEADSSEASMTKEQKLKAERLKRAKLFTSLIKSNGVVSGKVLPAALGQIGSQMGGSGSALSGSVSDVSRKEREGSSLPVDVEVFGNSDEKDSSHIKSKHGTNRLSLTHRGGGSDGDGSADDYDEYRNSKKHDSRSERDNRKHRRYRHSSKSNKECSEDEQPNRKRSRSGRHRHRHDDSSDDEHHHRSDSQWQRSHGDGKRENKERSLTSIPEYAFGSAKSLQVVSEDAVASVSVSRQDGTEVSDDLRAKVRAMLLATF